MDRLVSEVIADALRIIKKATERFAFLDVQENEYHNQTQDILHMLELEDANRDELARAARRLRKVRRERRVVKDEMEVLGPIVEYMLDEDNQAAINRLSEVLGQIRKVEKYHKNRMYIPKGNAE